MTGEERPAEGPDYRALIREAVREQDRFLRLTLSGGPKEGLPWVKVVVRPVQVKGKHRLQFSHFDGHRDVTRNYDPAEAAERLGELLALPFRRFQVETTDGVLHGRITRRGKVLLQREAAREESVPADALAHDRVKDQPLPLNRPDEFLRTLRVMDAAGRIRPGMQAKYRQINEFLRLLEQVLPSRETDEPLEIADCGSGNAYLTFAAYHYLTRILRLPARITGIDSNAEAVARSRARSESLGWPDLEFHVGRISEFVPARRPQVVLSLHACDTATDEAIALGVRSESQVILAAPCCQHELLDQLEAPLFQPVLRHGVLRQQMADLLTDTFRALALRIMGYRTDVVQFVSPEHTTKNLMIRAVRAGLPVLPQLAEEYRSLRDFWHVRPSIASLLGEAFAARLGP